jgi:hypothetical protein
MLPLDAFQPRGGVFAKGMSLHGGGGGIPIVSDVVDFVGDVGSSVGDVFSGAVEGVGDVLASVDPGPAIGGAVEDIGGVVQDIGQGAIDIVDDAGVFLDDAVNDVVPGGWATVGAAALAAATGYADPSLFAAEGAALGGGELAAAELMGPTIAELGAQAATTGLGEALGAGAFDALAADALASGQISGLTSGATDALLSQGLMDASTIANLSADPIGTLNAINNWTGPMAGNIGTVATELASQGIAEGELAKYLSSQFGIDQFAAANAAGIASAGGDAASIADVLAADYGANMAGLGGTSAGMTGAEALAAAKKAMQVAQVAKSGYGLVNALTGGSGNVKAASPLLRTTSLGSTLGGTSSGGGGALPGSLEGTSLAAAPVTQGSNMNINQLKQLYPQLSTIDPKLLQTLMGKAAATSAMGESGMGGGTTGLSMAGQGGTPSAGYPAIAADRGTGATRFAGESPLSGKFSALSAAGLEALGGAKNAYGLKDGGQPHIPQFKTGTTGHYVQGEGDGQSDDIPAMLADGEYVFDADTVAALGNGSNKAGALQLDRMRQEIRKHKRSAPHNKIPPKAKSPLEYMKEGK